LHTRIALDGYCFGKISRLSKWNVDFDRLRLCQLLSEREFKIIDHAVGLEDTTTPQLDEPGRVFEHLYMQFGGADKNGPQNPPEDWPEEFAVNPAAIIRPPVAIVWMLRELLFRNMNDYNNNQPWGIKDRFVGSLQPILLTIQHNFEMAHQIITTPVPLPYANLCKTLLAIFIVSVPFFVDYRLGVFPNVVIPAVVSLALLGIDAIATELENPFGDDDNDLDIQELMHVLEHEAMELLRLSGDFNGCARFDWQFIPEFLRGTSCRSLQRRLVLRERASPELLPI